MVSAGEVWILIYPVIRIVIWGIVGIAGVGGLAYWLLVVKKRRFWLTDVYEQKSDGKLYLVQKDRLQEKKINFGKQTIYVFRKTKTESIPPPFECVQRLGNKEYCDYIRVLGEYVPLEKIENIPDFNNETVRSRITNLVGKNLKKIRQEKTTIFKSDKVENRFVYIPVYKALKYDVDFKPISYDVNMMRINEIDSLDQMFKKKQDFWSKFGSMIIIGGGIVMVIVIAYMSFEYMQGVIGQTLSTADSVAKPLEALVNKISGSPPVT